ncbi:MAG: nucleotide sugar dehydrogenase [Alphaproteobacteria bacterium]|nr:nucleotide sugar dehydrogenase [Alphaproteobacteria bacterium]
MSTVYSQFSELKRRLEAREATIATVGLGYVGLPLALAVAEAGFKALGVDIDARRVADLNAGKRVISYFPENKIADAVASGRFSATSDFARLAEADAILICVPTPLDAAREPNMAYVQRAAQAIAKELRPGQLVVLESTTWPGATRNFVEPILRTSGLERGKDFFLAFSPEREDPGNASYTTKTIPKIVGGDDPRSLELAQILYSSVVTKAVPVSSTATAEAVKLAENTFRNVNIALVNEMKQVFAGMGVDVWEVIEAAATKPFGFMPFYPGPGIGGDCIPVSPVYLSWRARDVGGEMPLVDLAVRINTGMPRAIRDRLGTELAARGKSLAHARILLLGIAYKRDVEDSRESPALELLALIEEAGGRCDYHDPCFPVFPKTRDHAALEGRRSVALDAEAVASYDAVIVTTDHTKVDYALVADKARLILDTRNVLTKLRLAPTDGRYLKA